MSRNEFKKGAETMDPLSIAQNIYKLAATIYVQAKKVKANQAQCQLLADRVAAVESAIRQLGKLPDKDAFKQSLHRLNKCLIEICDYMIELSDQHWFRRFLNARSHESTFQGFNERLTLAISELSLGLDAQALLNREADQKAAQADYRVLLSKQDEILQLNQEILNRANKIPDENFHKLQHASLKLRLDQLFQIMMRESKLPAAAPSSPQSPKSPRLDLDAKIIIPYFELSLKEKLGNGTFGAVYRGLWHDKIVAIKVWDGRLSDREQAQFIREIQVLQRLHTPSFVPQFYGACLEAHQACLVQEYCPLGSLDRFLLKHRGDITPAQQKNIALSLAKSLQFLHNRPRPIVHRYLKSANVLLTEEKPGAPLQARITGFGLSKTQYPSIVSVQLKLDELTLGIAPEVLSGHDATTAGDVYSFGVILWEILTGLPRAKNMSLDGLDPAYARLIDRCWSRDPEQRPAMDEIMLALTPLPPPALRSVPIVEQAAEPPTGARLISPSPLSPAARAEDKPNSPRAATAPADPQAGLTPAVSAYEEAKRLHDQKDFVRARVGYERALAGGEEKARVKLATLLIRGNGGKPEELEADQARAIILFQQAAEKNDLLAMQNLAKALKHGIGTPADEKAAAHWQHRMKALSPSAAARSPSQNDAATPQFRSSAPSQAPSANLFARRSAQPGSPANPKTPEPGL